MFGGMKPYFVSFTAFRISDGERVFGNCVVEATRIGGIGYINALETMIEMDDPLKNIEKVIITNWKRFE